MLAPAQHQQHINRLTGKQVGHRHACPGQAQRTHSPPRGDGRRGPGDSLRPRWGLALGILPPLMGLAPYPEPSGAPAAAAAPVSSFEAPGEATCSQVGWTCTLAQHRQLVLCS